MKLPQTLLCAVSSIALTNLAGAKTCSDIRSIMNVWDNTAPGIRHFFTLTGTVHSANQYVKNATNISYFVIDDGTLLTTVFNTATPPVTLQTGNRIVASGIFGLKKYDYGNEPYASADQIKVLDTGVTIRPVERALQDLSGVLDNLRLVCTSGTIIDHRLDDTDPDYIYLILKDGATTMPVCIHSRDTDAADALIDTRVSVVGTFNRTLQGSRRFSSPFIASRLEAIKVISRPPSPAETPVLERKIYLTPKDILALGKRKICGEIIAVWQKRNLLLKDDDNRIVRVRLSHRNKVSPRSGRRATICGYPETDQFNIILGTATISSYAERTNDQQPSARPAPLTSVIEKNPLRKITLKPSCYGKLVTLGGTIQTLPSLGNAEGQISLDCDGYLVHLDTSSCPEATEGLQLGCSIEATGVSLFEMNDYDAQTDTPHVGGLTLVLRGKDDIVVLSRPPWLTPARFLVILAAMSGVLVLILIWNAALRVLVERRGRELARKETEASKARFKTVERTRLATELHDSVVQNLTGAALEIRAAHRALPEGADDSERILTIALKTIDSSRAELRNCIWDLRNHALEQMTVDEAIRITLQPHLGDTGLKLRFNVPRRKIPDSAFHTILCIIRELVINAVRHGRATLIRIAGATEQGRILFSVSDNGSGFDVAGRPGMAQGHFGIVGVTERAKSLGGTLHLESAPGMGTHATVNIPVSTEN